jgi:hypothetical protein
MAKRTPSPPPDELSAGGTQIDPETRKRVEEMKRRGGKRSLSESLRQLGSAALGGAMGVGEGTLGLGTLGYDVVKDTMTGGPVRRGIQAVSDYAHGVPVDASVPMSETDAVTREFDKGQEFWRERGADGPAMTVWRVAGNVVAPGPEVAQVAKTATRPARAFDASRRNFIRQTAAGVAGVPATMGDGVGDVIKSIIPDPNSPNIYTPENLDLWARLKDTAIDMEPEQFVSRSPEELASTWSKLRDEWVNRGLPTAPREYGDGDLVPNLEIFETDDTLKWLSKRWMMQDAMSSNAPLPGSGSPNDLQDIYRLDSPDITSAPTPKRPPFDPNADLSQMSEEEVGEWMEQAVGELGNQDTWIDESRPFYHGNNSTEPPDEIDYFWGELDGADPDNPFPSPSDVRAAQNREATELAELETPFDVAPIPAPQHVTPNTILGMVDELKNAPPNPLGPANDWYGDPFSAFNDSTPAPRSNDYWSAERETVNPDNPFPTAADRQARDSRDHEKRMAEYERRSRYYEAIRNEREAHKADPENTSFFSATTSKSLMERAKQRPVGTPPVVIDRTKEPLDEFRQRLDTPNLALAKRYAENAAKPEEVALVRDAAARIAEEYPRALRLVGRIELADTRHMDIGSILNPPLAWYGDNPGGVIKINTQALREEIAKNGPVAADALLYHELVHAAQHAIKPKGPGVEALEPSAYRRQYRLLGGVDDRQFKAEELPLSPREKKTGMEDWRYSKPQRRGAPVKSSKPGKW